MATSIARLKQDAQEEADHVQSRTHFQRALYRLRRDYLTLFALGIFGTLVLLTIFADPISNVLLGVSPFAEQLDNVFAPPSSEHLLGTDHKGRDVVSRLLYGGRISLSIAFFSAIISLSIGVSLGLATGYYGGRFDDFMNWVITTLNSIPDLYLLLIISAVVAARAADMPPEVASALRGPATLTFVLGILGWTGIMRLVRGETLALREREFVVAARAMGASNARIMFQHILPNLISIVIITLAISIGGLILTESGLSFLGFGINPPTPSWGNMLTGAQDFFKQAPLLAILPGLMIMTTVLCLYVIGDGLRDAFDPTTKD
ncbi:MAG: ABC transporter permease [Anaerolineae bacterium]|nr:ABC transporter permease [Anaerolineae bacterium]